MTPASSEKPLCRRLSIPSACHRARSPAQRPPPQRTRLLSLLPPPLRPARDAGRLLRPCDLPPPRSPSVRCRRDLAADAATDSPLPHLARPHPCRQRRTSATRTLAGGRVATAGAAAPPAPLQAAPRGRRPQTAQPPCPTAGRRSRAPVSPGGGRSSTPAAAAGPVGDSEGSPAPPQQCKQRISLSGRPVPISTSSGTNTRRSSGRLVCALHREEGGGAGSAASSLHGHRVNERVPVASLGVANERPLRAVRELRTSGVSGGEGGGPPAQARTHPLRQQGLLQVAAPPLGQVAAPRRLRDDGEQRWACAAESIRSRGKASLARAGGRTVCRVCLLLVHVPLVPEVLPVVLA